LRRAVARGHGLRAGIPARRIKNHRERTRLTSCSGRNLAPAYSTGGRPLGLPVSAASSRLIHLPGCGCPGRVAQITFRFGCGADIPVCRFRGLSSPRIPRQTVGFGLRNWKTSQPAGSKACPTGCRLPAFLLLNPDRLRQPAHPCAS